MAPQSAIDGGVLRPGAAATLFAGQVGDLGNAQPRLSRNPRTGDPYPGGERDVLNATFIGEWATDLGTFSSLTGYLDGTASQYIDGDQDVVPNPAGNRDDARGVAEFRSSTDTEIFSQELRFASDLDGPLQFTTGALYWSDKSVQIDTGVTILAPFGAQPDPGYYNLGVAATTPNPGLTARETEHWSIYGLVEWEFSETWRATFEGRYANERVEVRGPSCGILPPFDFTCGFVAPSLATEFPPGVFTQPALLQAKDEVRDNYFAPKATLEWNATDNALIYASIAQGVKPAGISAVGGGSFLDADRDLKLDEAKFDKEKLLVYELGAKTEWFDNALQINGAMFFQEYTDKQIAIRRLVGGFPAGFIENAGEADVFGIELDTVWVPADNWTVQLSYTYLNGEYTDFKYETDSVTNISRAGNCAPNASGTLCTVDLTGATLEDIPEHAFSGSVGYRNGLADTGMEWFVESYILYRDERFDDEFNDRQLDSFSVVDLLVGIDGDNWNLVFYVNNVFDNDTFQGFNSTGGGIVETAERTAFFPASGLGYAPDPRNFGLRANMSF
jgi:iron complex outermembrane receptor protein